MLISVCSYIGNDVSISIFVQQKRYNTYMAHNMHVTVHLLVTRHPVNSNTSKCKIIFECWLNAYSMLFLIIFFTVSFTNQQGTLEAPPLAQEGSLGSLRTRLEVNESCSIQHSLTAGMVGTMGVKFLAQGNNSDRR